MKSDNDVKAKDMADADGHIASTLMGASVYNSPDKNGKTIGKVDDLVIDKGGKITSLVVGVGGFLGIGSKDVAIDYSQVKWEQGNGSWWIIVPTTTEELKSLPDFDPKPYQPAEAQNSTSGDATTTSSTGTTSGMTGTGGAATTTPAAPDTTKKQ
jgi:sporulation protein YlmC with PRC-barrel domain